MVGNAADVSREPTRGSVVGGAALAAGPADEGALDTLDGSGAGAPRDEARSQPNSATATRESDHAWCSALARDTRLAIRHFTVPA